jgi:hypothetical protein
MESGKRKRGKRGVFEDRFDGLSEASEKNKRIISLETMGDK